MYVLRSFFILFCLFSISSSLFKQSLVDLRLVVFVKSGASLPLDIRLNKDPVSKEVTVRKLNCALSEWWSCFR